MVNYRRVCEVTVLASTILLAAAVPLPSPDCDKHVYDQRQNGSENYRLNIDGVVIAVAPAESLLSAVSDIDLSDLFDIESLSETGLRPKPPSNDLLLGEEPAIPKPDDKPNAAKPDNKPLQAKPEDKPKPEEKPQESQLSNVSLDSPAPQKEEKQKKSAVTRKQESAQRLKHRIASIFLPFLRKRRHQ